MGFLLSRYVFTKKEPVVEFGAQWIHGQINNPVYEICKREGLVNDGYASLDENFYHWQQLDDEQNGNNGVNIR